MEPNVEQTKLIEAVPSGQSLIKGVAGSGKTTVALHRALFLHRNYCTDPADRILLATFNRTLVNYLMYIYEKVEEKYKASYANIFSDDEDRVDIMSIDQLIYHYYIKNLAEPNLKPLYDFKEALRILVECAAELRKKYEDVVILEDTNFLLDEINWIKSCHYLELEEYQKVDRLGRTIAKSEDSPQRLAKNSKTRRAIYDLMLAFDRRMQENGYIHPRDIAVKALEHARENQPNIYKHVIIDEGQDLTRVQIEFLKTIYRDDKDSSFNFITDTSQSIYPHAWLVKGRSFASVGLDMSGKSSALAKNYRTSTQVSQAAYSMLEKDPEITDCEYFVRPALLDQQGHYPVLKSFTKSAEEANYVVSEVKKLIGQGYKHPDIAVIARMRKQLEPIKSCFDQAGIPNTMISTMRSTFDEESVRLLSMHAIKGLEYPVVFIVGLNSGVIPYTPSKHKDQDVQESNERKLLYVGMTRALELLYLSCWGRPSKFIRDIDPEYLRLSSGSKMRVFYKVNVDDYLFTEKIQRTFSPEEEVRQWVLRELMDTYHYPLELLEIERKVNLFSTPGLIDITINTYRDDKLSPLIVIETKAPGTDLAAGLEQLKSYMKVSKDCQYGLLTNGHDLMVVNSNYDPVDDIPGFHRSMLPVGGEAYKYLDLQTKEYCTLKMDYESNEKLLVERSGAYEGYADEDTFEAPLFQKAAAGSPHLMDEQADEFFCLPTEWFKGKNIFALQVKGDSMTGAGIDDGDMVVVEKRNYADNLEIVVVAFNNECVIKKYSSMGEDVVLLSEHKDYEPVSVKTEQARILGVALGVIKGKSGE